MENTGDNKGSVTWSMPHFVGFKVELLGDIYSRKCCQQKAGAVEDFWLLWKLAGVAGELAENSSWAKLPLQIKNTRL